MHGFYSGTWLGPSWSLWLPVRFGCLSYEPSTDWQFFPPRSCAIMRVFFFFFFFWQDCVITRASCFMQRVAVLSSSLHRRWHLAVRRLEAATLPVKRRVDASSWTATRSRGWSAGEVP